jgi:hypothetical protein
MTIPEIRAALDAVGVTSLDARARALDIGRSTCQSIFSDNRKQRGITAQVLSRMLRSSHLPASARAVVIDYAMHKANKLAERHRRKFIRALNGTVHCEVEELR